MTFTKKQYTNLPDEIFANETKTNKVLTGGIFVIILAILGLSIIMLSIQYSVNNQTELINLKEMNQ